MSNDKSNVVDLSAAFAARQQSRDAAATAVTTMQILGISIEDMRKISEAPHDLTVRLTMDGGFVVVSQCSFDKVVVTS